jgi:hypothetical protein
MNRVLLRRVFASSVLMLVAAPVLAQDRADAMLVLADDGALDAPAVRAIRSLAAGELRKRGISLSEDRRSEGLKPIDSSLSTLAGELGARRVFALRIGGQLGQKIPLSLDELTPSSLAPVYSATMTAHNLDECDVVTARLVQAVIDRRSPENTAELKTVTAAESKPFAKKPGERFWFIGLPIALYNGGTGTSPFGLSVGYGYEAENFRINASAGGFSRGNDGAGYLVLEAFWIPLQGELSPYIGGGLGYMGAYRGGMGGSVEGGIEAFRLHGVRGLAGVQFLIPFFDNSHDVYDPSSPGATRHASGRAFYPAAFIRLAF